MRFVGLDLGTQSLKAVVCDEQFALLGQHAVPCETQRPAPDHVTQAARGWETALGVAIGGALAASGTRSEDVAAIAIVGQLDGCVPVGGDGAAIHDALIWQDRRAVDEALRVSATDVFAITGQVADASHMAPKILWLREHGVRAARWHQPVSYLVSRLTGEHVLDPALASTTMLLELATRTWSPRLLAGFAIDAGELPELRDACAIAGPLTPEGAALTGLVAGTPVAVGTGDDFANVLGAGVTQPGTLVCAVGTAEVVGILSAVPVLDRVGAEPLVETHLFPAGGYFVEHPGWMAGGAVRWGARMFGLDDAAFDTHALAGSAGLVFVPALAGQMTPVWRPQVRGGLHGLSLAHGVPHIAAAIFEGLTFATRDVVERLRAMGLSFDEVLLVGGGARAHGWCQLRADVLGLRHRVAANVDGSPLAAAMIAGVAAGAFADLASAAAHVAPPADTYEPAPRPALEEAYRRYQALIAGIGRSADV